MTLENTPPLSAAGAVGTATTSAADTSVNSAASFFMLTTVLRGSAALHADSPFTRRRSGETLAPGRFDGGGTMSHRGQVATSRSCWRPWPEGATQQTRVESRVSESRDISALDVAARAH